MKTKHDESQLSAGTEMALPQQGTEMRYRTLFEHVPDGIFIADPEGNILDANSNMCRMLGYPRNELIGLRLTDIVSQSEIQLLLPALKEIELNTDYKQELQFQHKDGSALIVALALTKMPDSNILGIIRDLSEREQSIIISNRLAAIEDSSDDAIISKDLNGIITSWNRGAEKIFGYSAVEMVGTSILRLIPADRQDEESHILAQIRHGQKVAHLETKRQTKDKRLIDVSVTISPIKDGVGKIIGAQKIAHDITILRDITRLKQAEKSVRHAWEKLHKLFEILPVGVAIIDSGMTIVDCNVALAKILRISKDELLQGAYKQWRVLRADGSTMPAEEYPSVRAINEQRAIIDIEIGITLESGDVIWALVSTAPLSNDPDSCIVITADITERKQAEMILRASTDEIEDLYNHAPCGYHSLDKDGIICRINDTELSWLGYTREEIVGKIHYQDLLASSSRQNFPVAFQQLKQQGYIQDFEVDIVRKDGSVFSGLVNATAIYDDNKEFLRSRTTITDITVHKQTEQQLRELTGHIQSVLEEEKAEIAREIHDHLGGTLTTMKMEAYWLKTKLPAICDMDDDGLLEHIREISQLIDSAMEITRHIITGLRPTILDDLGIVAALEWLAEQFQKHTSIECRVNCVCDSCDICEVKLDKPLSITLFRIAQEALTNVARHSRASSVEIEFHCGDEEVVMSVIDNGRGMAAGKTEGDAHFGLLGMRERANRLGGTLILDQPPGGGLNVTVVLPLTGGNSHQKEQP